MPIPGSWIVRWNPPADPSKVRMMTDQYGILPQSLGDLYMIGDGFDAWPQLAGAQVSCRILRVDESLAYTVAVSARFGSRLPATAVVFADDGNSNPAVLYTDSPIRGYIAILDHDDPDFAPVFRDMDGFFASVSACHRRHEGYYYDLTFVEAELPAVPGASEDEDLGRMRTFLAEAEKADSEEKRVASLLVAIRLTPPSAMGVVSGLLEDESVAVVASAAQLCQYRRFVPALHSLVQIAMQPGGIEQMASIRAILEWKPKAEARAAIEVLKRGGLIEERGGQFAVNDSWWDSLGTDDPDNPGMLI